MGSSVLVSPCGPSKGVEIERFEGGIEGVEDVLGGEYLVVGIVEFAVILLGEPPVAEGAALLLKECGGDAWAVGGGDADALPTVAGAVAQG